MTENIKISLDAKRFAAVALAASSEATRDYLCGVHLEEKDGQLVAVATDGHILLYAVVSPKGKGAEMLPDVRLTPTAPVAKASAKGKAETLRLELISPSVWQWATLDHLGQVLEMGQTEAGDRTYFPEGWARIVPRKTGEVGKIQISGRLLARLAAAAKLTAPGPVSKQYDPSGFSLVPTESGPTATGPILFSACHLSGCVMPMRQGEEHSAGAGVNIHD